MWDVLKGKEKPSRQTLDKLALLAGFQSWDDFQGALHGTEDGLVNYDAGENKEWSMVGLVGSHDLLNCKDSCFRYKIVDIKRKPGRETGFPLFFLIRSPKKIILHP